MHEDTFIKIWFATGFCLLLIASILLVTAMIQTGKKMEETRAIVNQQAEYYDGLTTEEGIYIRDGFEGPGEHSLPVTDSWGRHLTISYSQGGGAERLVVRSPGHDGWSHTTDDIWTSRSSVTFAGIGRGIKNNIEET